MKKFSLIMAVAFTMASVNAFADGKPDSAKTMCKAGKSCCKKMTSASAATKAKCAKACKDAAKKA